MSLHSAGDKLGPFEILALLGAGGMGEVYRARDTRMGRDVAIKVAAEAFNERFDREVRAVAALNHPNICTLHDVGPNYLVLELVEGLTLAEHIRGTAIPLEESLNIARQIVDALEAAHEKGIVHRDLKPGNIKIKPDGTVKVLDFGLAKVNDSLAAELDNSPTMSMAATGAGVILGTAAYMSPEQARGKPVDKRADIWAFGVVLYEMLTGGRLFKGETSTDILGAVVGQEPDWSRVPARARHLVKSCLQKDPRHRLHDIADVKLLLDEEPPAEHPRQPKVAWMTAAVLTVALAVALWAPWRTPAPEAEPIRLNISLPDNVNAAGRVFTLSPDGRKLAFYATGSDGIPRLWVRFLDSLEVRPLTGTETPSSAPLPFWSPDSRFVAYTASGAKLKTVDLTGSPPQTLCDSVGPNVTGGSWNRDGAIIFGSTTSGLTRVSSSGGATAPVTVPDPARKDVRHAFPTFLPDGKRFLYLRTSSVPENSGVYIGSLDAKPNEQDSKRLVATTFSPVYVPSTKRGRGSLLIFREGNVLAYAFDEERTEILGDPVIAVSQVGSTVATGFFSAAAGALVYRSSGASQNGRLIWFNRQGSVVLSPEQPSGLRAVALSPDGQRAGLVRQDLATQNLDIWTWDTTRGSSTRLTSEKFRAESPVWSPDGGYVVFASNRDGPRDLYRKLSGESKDEVVLLKSVLDKTPTSISPDGRFLLYTQSDSQTRNDVWILSNPGVGQGDRKSTPFLNREFNENEARFSPGPEAGVASAPRWVAYTSDASGRNEVYVREFSQSDRTWPVSTAGGSNPRWRADGEELLFAAPDGTVMSVDIAPGATFKAGAPGALFRVPSAVLPNWDVTADGKRFLVLVQVQQGAQAPFTVWQNWQAGLTK